MDGPDRRTHGDAETAAEDWLRARLTAHVGDVPVPPPDLARIDARRRGIRRRRTGWTVCAVSAVAAGAVVAGVAFAGGGADDRSRQPLPLAPPTTVGSPTPGPTALPPSPTGTEGAPPPPGTPETPATGLPDGTDTTGQGATTAAATPVNPATATTGSSSGRTNSPSTAGSSGTVGANSGSGSRACTDKNVSITASVSSNDSGRHILLTATNTGSTTCTLYYYPDVVFGDGSHEPVLPMESPAQVATIAPGKKAYSGLLLYKPGEKVTRVTSFAVNLLNADNSDYAGYPIDMAIPSGLGGALDIGPYPGTYMWNTDLAQLNSYLYAR